MSATSRGSAVPWWKEPTKDQWYAYMAAWLGWTLDAFDFTVFLLIMSPIAQEFGLPFVLGLSIFITGRAHELPEYQVGSTPM